MANNDPRFRQPNSRLLHEFLLEELDVGTAEREHVAIEEALAVSAAVEDATGDGLRNTIAAMLSCRVIRDEHHMLGVVVDNQGGNISVFSDYESIRSPTSFDRYSSNSGSITPDSMEFDLSMSSALLGQRGMMNQRPRARKPPDGYLCHLCFCKGHYIKDCPEVSACPYIMS